MTRPADIPVSVQIIEGDCLNVMREMEPRSVHCCITSPPYFGLRDYGVDGQIGLEDTPDAYVAKLVAVFEEVRRVLRDDGTVWLNLGDSYAGSGRGGNPPDSPHQKQQTNRGSKSVDDYRDMHDNLIDSGAISRKWVKPPPGFKAKDLIGIPWRVAFALQAAGWYLRQDIIWHKPNPMPESVRDRCTKAHEYIFLLSKSPRYYYDAEAIKEPANPKNHRDSRSPRRVGPGQSPDAGFVNGRHYETRNKRSVWTVATKPFKEAHFATFPPDLIEPCILAGCPPGGTVLDPFAGAGTTCMVASRHGRNSIGIELNAEYTTLARERS